MTSAIAPRIKATPTTGMKARRGILTLAGYGLRIGVERGHLVVEDGIADERRRGRFSRVSKLRRLVVLGHAGTVTLEALRWLRDVGAAFIQIDADGQVVAATGPLAVSDPRVLRGQVLAAENGLALSIARRLVSDKLQGQLNVLRRLPAIGHDRSDSRVEGSGELIE